MKVYELQTDRERFCNFALADERGSWIHSAFDGRPISHRWEPYRITAADEPDAAAQLADYALLGVIPVFSRRAVDALRDVLRANGELLGLRYSRGDYYAYNITTVLDALDEERSQLQRFSTGRVMLINTYVFRPDRLIHAVIFKISQFPGSYVYVTEEFVQGAHEARLEGLHFRQIWEEEVATPS